MNLIPTTPPAQKQKAIGHFVVVSLLLHGVALGIYKAATPVVVLGSMEQGESTLKIQLKAQQPQSNPTTTPQESPITEPAQEPVDLQANEAPMVIAQEAQPILTDPSPQPALKPETQATLSAPNLRQRILTKFDTFFFYPRLAAHKGWSGEVLLQISFNQQDGRIQDIQLKKSSGYSLLDQSALSAMEKLQQTQILDPEPSRPGGLTLLELPVIYRLQG